MAGRTTFVIAHRLSTIALADEIVVLEHGRVAAHGSHDDLLEESDLYREIVEKGMPDQVFMTRKPLGGGGTVSRRSRHPPSPAPVERPGPQAPRPDRAALALPLAGARDVRLARGRDRRRARAGAAGQAGHRRGDPAPRRRRARFDRRAVPGLGDRLRGRHLCADLPRRLGRPARAPGPARPPVRPPAAAVDRLLLAQPGRRDHLEDDQRRRGARPARRGRDGDADPVRADADRRGRDPVRARLAPRAADVPRAAGARRRRVPVPDRLGRRLPADPREDRRDHRLPAGDAVRDPRRPRVRPGARAHRAVRASSTTRTGRRT